MRVEKQLEELEREMKTIKSSFMQSAAQMNIVTTKINFSTQSNICSFEMNQSHDYQDWLRIYGDFAYYVTSHNASTYYCDESVVVTFRSSNGSNTIVNLEIEGNLGAIYIRRVPFSGGARWILRIGPNVTPVYTPDGVFIDYWTWAPTDLTLAVQSGVSGILEAKMIWQ